MVMADSRRTSDPAHPRNTLERLVRNLRLRLEGEARAGLAAAPRAKRAPTQKTSPDTTPGAMAPERRAAESIRSELAGRAGAASEVPPGCKTPEPTPPIPLVHLAGPGLFDQSLPDETEGMSREEAIARVVTEVAECTQCPELVANRTHTVPGQGSPYAKIMFIGEGPGQDEDVQGLAFVGRAGQLLTKMIESIGMTREEVFIANIVKCRTPGNRQPAPDEAATCAPYLARQIAIIRPKVIVALGGVAAQNLLGTHDGITRLRGRFYPYMGTKLMPTFHPAYVLRNYTPDTRKKVYDDLLKARAELTA